MTYEITKYYIMAISFSLSWVLTACLPRYPDIDGINYYDLGTVAKGELAIADLPVRNLGDSPLEVEAISTSCGCTTAQLSSMTIPAGGEATLHVEYESDAHEADMGNIERFIFI